MGYGNASVMGSSNTNVPLYPSLAKRGEGRFYQHYFKIPLCQRGIKTPKTEGLPALTETFNKKDLTFYVLFFILSK